MDNKENSVDNDIEAWNQWCKDHPDDMTADNYPDGYNVGKEYPWGKPQGREEW